MTYKKVKFWTDGEPHQHVKFHLAFFNFKETQCQSWKEKEFSPSKETNAALRHKRSAKVWLASAILFIIHFNNKHRGKFQSNKILNSIEPKGLFCLITIYFSNLKKGDWNHKTQQPAFLRGTHFCFPLDKVTSTPLAESWLIKLIEIMTLSTVLTVVILN